MNINTISDTILDEASSAEQLREALDAFVLLCGEITNIRPDPSFNAWAQDSLLDDGVAINTEAAAHCALDYERSVVFIRGVYAAINALQVRFPGTVLEILYAGCGPFATLLLPLLGKIDAGQIRLSLLDVHQRSLDSVQLLLTHFGFRSHTVQTIRADACHYRHTCKLHLIIVEAMQKALEQEPQFAITANLAPQLWPCGIFIPQRIDVSLCLADLEHEKEMAKQLWRCNVNELKEDAGRYLIKTVCTLDPEGAFDQMQRAQTGSDGMGLELEPIIIEIPMTGRVAQLDAALFTTICVFEQYALQDYDSQITLPLKCHELAPLIGGDRHQVSYQFGSYPRFNFKRLIQE